MEDLENKIIIIECTSCGARLEMPLEEFFRKYVVEITSSFGTHPSFLCYRCFTSAFIEIREVKEKDIGTLIPTPFTREAIERI